MRRPNVLAFMQRRVMRHSGVTQLLCVERQKSYVLNQMPPAAGHQTAVLLVVIAGVALASVFAILVFRRIAGLLLALVYRYWPSAIPLFVSSESAKCYLRSTRALANGRPEEAVEHASQLLEPSSGFNWLWVNCAVNAMINAGSYKEALRLKARWNTDFLERARRRHPDGYLLVQVNLAEALYNLGRFRCAKRLLEDITPECNERGSRLVRAGLIVQKAWLSVLMGDPVGALEKMVTVNERHLPRNYRAEVHFTRAAALRDVGRLHEAKMEALRGLKLSRRASSTRNALFMLGSVAAEDGQPERAIELLEEGATHSYRAQGAEGLVLLGDQYRRVGRNPQSKQAYVCAIARDPQGYAARWARRRLREEAASA